MRVTSRWYTITIVGAYTGVLYVDWPTVDVPQLAEAVIHRVGKRYGVPIHEVAPSLSRRLERQADALYWRREGQIMAQEDTLERQLPVYMEHWIAEWLAKHAPAIRDRLPVSFGYEKSLYATGRQPRALTLHEFELTHRLVPAYLVRCNSHRAHDGLRRVLDRDLGRGWCSFTEDVGHGTYAVLPSELEAALTVKGVTRYRPRRPENLIRCMR
jgi:hypothetical protein